MSCDPTLFAGAADDEPVEVPLPPSNEDEDADDGPLPDELSFCELCGTSEADDEELLRCEECGKLICANCREYDEEGTPYCGDCSDELAEA